MTNSAGEQIQTKHQYRELASNLHYRNSSGQWVPTRDESELSRTGRARLPQNGPHKLFVPADIYSGAIQIIGPDGRVQTSRPMGIALVDGTNSVLIAELTNSVAKLLPSGNQVMYEKAFTALEARIC